MDRGIPEGKRSSEVRFKHQFVSVPRLPRTSHPTRHRIVRVGTITSFVLDRSVLVYHPVP